MELERTLDCGYVDGELQEEVDTRSEEEKWYDLLVEKDKLQEKENKTADYLPSPKTIEKRIKFMKWMKKNKFQEKVIDRIMIHDVLSMQEVYEMVDSLGIRKARKEIRVIVIGG